MSQAQDTHRVPPGRLAAGRGPGTTGRGSGEGDIRAAYSADTIALSGLVRTPFRFGNAYWTTVCVRHVPEPLFLAYRLVPRDAFCDPVTTYAEEVRRDGGTRARAASLGFYHGMQVRWRGLAFVLSGPPAGFLSGAADPVQGELFLGAGS